MSIGTMYQSGDWKGEKHVPVIHAPETAKKARKLRSRSLLANRSLTPIPSSTT